MPKGICAVCGAPLPQKKSAGAGRLRMYCSARCRSYAAKHRNEYVNNYTTQGLLRELNALDADAAKARATGLSYGEARARGLI